MKRNRIPFLLVLILLLSFCARNNKNNAETEKPLTIKIDLSKQQEIPITEFAEEIEYVKLETSDKSLFPSMHKLIINDQGIFILEKISTRTIYHFSLDGKFLGTIGQQGKGNGEYILPLDFLVREDKKQVEIVDNFTRSNFKYDFKGNFIDRINYKDYLIKSITLLNNDNYLLKLGINKGLEHEGFHFIITDLNMINTKKEFIPATNDADFINNEPFSNISNNSVLSTYGFNDTIYEITSTDYRPKYIVDFGKSRLGEKDILKGQKFVMGILLSTDRAGYISHLVKTEDALFFNFLSKRIDYLVDYNIKNGSYTLISKLKQSDSISFSAQLYSSYNNKIVFKADAMDINNTISDKNTVVTKSYGKFKSFSEVQQNTKLNDNPILIFIKPKK